MDKIDKQILTGFIGAVALIIFWATCINFISPGYVGVLINTLEDDQQITAKSLSVGIHCTAPWKKVYKFPVFEQNTVWEDKDGFDFQTTEGMAIHANVGVTYHLRLDKVAIIFQKYRKGMEEITQIFIRNYIRDAINKTAAKFKIEDLYSSGKEDFLSCVEQNVRRDLEPLGIEISRIYLIGRFQFPDTVVSALNSKIEANQRAQQRENELREAEAEAKKQIAIAEGKSTANKMLSQSLTPDLIQWQMIQKWDGKLPHVTGGAMPLLSLDK